MVARVSIPILENDEDHSGTDTSASVNTENSRGVILETDGTRGNRNGRSKDQIVGRMDPRGRKSQSLRSPRDTRITTHFNAVDVDVETIR